MSVRVAVNPQKPIPAVTLSLAVARYRNEKIMAIEDFGQIFDAEGNDITDSVIESMKPVENTSGLRRKFEEGLAETKAMKEALANAEASAQASKRELVLRDSGLDLTNPTAKYFADTYNGDLTVDAVKEMAAKIGLIPLSQSPEIIAGIAAQERIAQASVLPTSGAGSTLTPEQEIANFQGNAEAFDAWFAQQNLTPIDRTQAGAVWDSPAGSPAARPVSRR